jgi:hypothetical protein
MESTSRRLTQEETERMQNCSEEIKNTLSKYKCVLDASMLVTSRGSEPRIFLVPLENKNEEKVEVPSFEE